MASSSGMRYSPPEIAPLARDASTTLAARDAIETRREDGPSAVSVSTKVVLERALRPIDDDRRLLESKPFPGEAS